MPRPLPGVGNRSVISSPSIRNVSSTPNRSSWHGHRVIPCDPSQHNIMKHLRDKQATEEFFSVKENANIV